MDVYKGFRLPQSIAPLWQGQLQGSALGLLDALVFRVKTRVGS